MKKIADIGRPEVSTAERKEAEREEKGPRKIKWRADRDLVGHYRRGRVEEIKLRDIRKEEREREANSESRSERIGKLRQRIGQKKQRRKASMCENWLNRHLFLNSFLN